jgi:hypothetical protein
MRWPDRLAGVEEHQRTPAVSDVSDLTDRSDDAAVVRHMHHGDQSHSLIHQLGEAFEIDATGRALRNGLEADALAMSEAQQVERVVRVLRPADQHTVPRPEADGAEKLGPATGAAVHQRDRPWFTTEKPSQRAFQPIEIRSSLGGCSVTTHLGLPLQVGYDGADNLPGRERGTGAV